MDAATMFIASTFSDLGRTRAIVQRSLAEAGYNAVLAERGDITYDPDLTAAESCRDKVRRSHVFVMIVSRRYGSPTVEDAAKKSYQSITRLEFEAARESGIPVYAFVQADLKSDYEKFRRNGKSGGDYPSVEDTQVFELIMELEHLRRNKLLEWYEDAGDISSRLLRQLAGLVRIYLSNKKREKVQINCFKLFYHRANADKRLDAPLSVIQLAEATGIPKSVLRRIEKKRHADDQASADVFHSCEAVDIERLETVLCCPGKLRAGQSDDFLTKYQIFYEHKGRRISKTASADQLEFSFDTRAIVFDFDGTLTYERSVGTTWERLWEAACLQRAECSRYHDQFRRKEITHGEWCDITGQKFRKQGLTRAKIEEVAASIELVPDVIEVIKQLKQRGIHVSILSGSIKQVISRVLGSAMSCVDELRANEIIFDNDGVVAQVVGTEYDYEKKPKFIKEIIRRRQIKPLEVLFVGNSSNDKWASRSGARTLCVNPIEADPGNYKDWTFSIRHMKSLSEILPYVTSREVSGAK